LGDKCGLGVAQILVILRYVIATSVGGLFISINLLTDKFTLKKKSKLLFTSCPI